MIFALVGRYPTNKLIMRGLILRRNPKAPFAQKRLSGISIRFQMLSRAKGQITHVLLTRAPVAPKGPLTCMC